ncbi:MFS transporter [Saccharopolyspora rosea]|uniref:MFS transporter n=1 Tax=Saccharopolyspora rosea TaxID=524884 RepID=A0ABW3FR36_9PSEU
MRSRIPLAVYVLGFGVFALVTTEFMVSGLEPELAGAFRVSVPEIGYLISAYAAAMALGGPLLTMALVRVPRKRALLVLVGTFLVGQVLGAVATGYGVLAVARVVTGAAASAFFGTAVGVGMDLVRPEVRGRAASVVLGGLMVGTVFGLPLATVVGQHLGWRASFWGDALLALVAAVATVAVVPRVSAGAAPGLRAELAAFRSGRLWAAYLTSMLIIGATFAAFSYFTPILTGVSGFSPGTVPILLVVYGAATVVGNNVVGRLADRYAIPVQVGGLVALALALVVFGAFGSDAVVAVVSLVVVGLVGITMNPAMATRVQRAAGTAPLVSTAHVSMVNIGLMFGAWAGGAGISLGFGLTAPLWIGAVLAVVGLASLVPELVRTSVPEPVAAVR